MDIEGAERLLFEKELDVVLEKYIGIFIEIHKNKLNENKLREYLNEIQKNFSLVDSKNGENAPVKLFLK